MAGEIIKTDGIVLAIHPWSRTSHIVTWLTPDHGCVTTLVKGAVRPKSAFLGQYDLFYTCDLLYYARARGDLHALRETTPRNLREGLRGLWRETAVAGYAAGLVKDLVPANGDSPEGLILPIITLALYPMAYITRLTRSSMLDVLGQDYIRTAKAKGVSGKRIIFGHALKNSLIPVLTYLGPMLAYIVTGSLVVEKIFAVPGIGRAFVSSITNRDYTMIMGTTIILATLIVFMNLVTDILYKVVDPRITLE